jgi:exosome complex RNA-binding protein Rrp42 (RNase PH superfamily)
LNRPGMGRVTSAEHQHPSPSMAYASSTSNGRSSIGTVSLAQHPSSSPGLSKSECNYIRQGCQSNCRTDGRAQTQVRCYTIVAGSAVKLNQTNFPQMQQQSLFLSSLLSSYGSSRLYDTSTNGSLIDMICSIKAELVQPSAATSEGEMDINLCSTDILSSEISNLLLVYETALEKYYVPCLLNSMRRHLAKNNNKSPDQHSTNTSSTLCVIPGTVVWKLYIDIYILSSLSHNHFGSSVYYLDAVTHCINAALYETVLPPLTILNDDNSTLPTSAAILTNIVLDSEMTHAQPLLCRAGEPPKLPVVITVHAIHPEDPLAKGISWILDATAEEAFVASCTMHAVIVPNADVYHVGAVWTSSGSLPMVQLPHGLHVAQTAAPGVYQQFQRLEDDIGGKNVLRK